MNKNPEEAWILPVGEYRSRSEYFFAKWCEKWRIPFSYEPECFQIPGPTGPVRYIPDFYLTESNIFVEVKPAIFKGELWKFESFLKTIPSFESHDDPTDEERDSWAIGWAVEIHNQEPVAIALYDDCGMDDSRYDYQENNGFWVCEHCGRPYIIPIGSYTCHHCKNYPGGGGGDPYPDSYDRAKLSKSINKHKEELKKMIAKAYEDARIEGEKERAKRENDPF
jgi:hypothetical protein